MKGTERQINYAMDIVGNIVSHIEKKQTLYKHHGADGIVQVYEDMKNEILHLSRKFDAGMIIEKRHLFDADRIDTRVIKEYERRVKA